MPEFIDKAEEIRDEQPIRHVEPNEPSELVALDPNCPEDMVRLGTKMEQEIRQAMKQLLTEHWDVFS